MQVTTVCFNSINPYPKSNSKPRNHNNPAKLLQWEGLQCVPT